MILVIFIHISSFHAFTLLNDESTMNGTRSCEISKAFEDFHSIINQLYH